jgi:toxic protein SymE
LYRHAVDRRVPILRLRGLSLEQLGFAIGSKVRITARAGKVVVSVVEGDAVSTQT